MDIRNEIKSHIVREGLTIKEVDCPFGSTIRMERRRCTKLVRYLAKCTAWLARKRLKDRR